MSTSEQHESAGSLVPQTAPPGWYRAPDGTYQEQYWDGSNWVATFRPMANRSVLLFAPDGSPVSPKSRLAVLLFAIFLGSLGVHSFFVGKVGVGLGQLAITIFTCGLFGWIWPLVDVVLIAVGTYKDKEGRLILNWDS
ncbi:MAG: TM2 domain-containing protein [Actinomycetota bacterium]|nr:TM2 domain-containing protein [Actinomycetota bacterium]